jgi:hypothetical protein
MGPCTTSGHCGHSLLQAKAKANDTASSKPAPPNRTISKSRQQSKTAAAAAAKPRRTHSRTTGRQREASAAIKQRQWWQQQQQQQQQRELSHHRGKLVPAPFQGTGGDLRFTGELRWVLGVECSNALATGSPSLIQLGIICSEVPAVGVPVLTQNMTSCVPLFSSPAASHWGPRIAADLS